MLWLIRRGSAEQLGSYVFWANSALVAGTLAAAFTSVHLYRLPPAPSPGRRRAERVLLSGNLLLALLMGLLTLLVVPWLGATLGLWIAALFLPCTILALHARVLATTHGALGAAAAISAAPLLAVGCGMGAELVLGRTPSVPLLLALNGLAQGVAGAIVIRRLGGPWPMDFGAGARRRWRALARRSRWSLAAGLGNEVFTRLYIFVVPAWFGAAALAGLAAAQAMLRPATLLAGAFGAAARRPLARLRHEGDAAGFWRLLTIGALGPACATLLLGGVVAALWPWIAAWVFGGRYAGLEKLVLLWSVVMAISCFWVAGLAGLQVLGRLRALAMAEIGGALVCALAMAPMLLLLDAPGALLAIALGGVVQVTLLASGVRRGLRDLAPNLVPAAGAR
ncbi:MULTISPECIES: polysaccharide biosynthesis protein [Roseomonadaceae]|uniref:Polysaccharide biosynthesis protein n=1 Tax=Falsiroseomonas oleicola TaxID=2801474 RepID=A0ABS6HA72_9PROT|nr:hypothetical protein [Roseomonas oleicola]MBU8544873.1 hypothetical protein [Roseomonas oleicola]